MVIIYFILFLTLVQESVQFHNKFFNYWQCIGITENIDFTKPYRVNVGHLPLVVWKKKGALCASINICKHMGSRLDNGLITEDGNLQCQYHGLEYCERDIVGETVEHDGKIFWAYKPINKKPFSTPFFNNKDYEHSFIEVDMECSMTDSIYNTMDLRHPSYVHNKIVGFGSLTPPQNIVQYKYRDRLGLSFDYNSNKIIRAISNNTKSTCNYHQFIYPNFGWSRVTFDKTKHIVIGVNLLPLSPTKTRWYITVCHNYHKSPIQKLFIKSMAATILSQDYLQMINQYPENELKKEILFTHVFQDEEVILWLKDMMHEYEYPNINMCVELYRDYRHTDKL
jgi:phenylpropionate dioxygenase-like ring-hydroxylating dioxygenase large terminal subunit